MSGNIVENVDFDGDQSFSGTDLDISWAYLQVKALLDSGSSDVDTYNFREKVIEQYNLNKSAGIAEPSTKTVTNLPGKLSLGMPAGINQTIFLKKWTCNDMFEGTSVPNDRSASVTTELFESVDGKKAGNIVNGSWPATKKSNTAQNRLLYLDTSGRLDLDDGGSISNITSWVLHWRAYTRYLGKQTLLRKGDPTTGVNAPVFEIKCVQNKKDLINPGGPNVDKIWVRTGKNANAFFQFPFGKKVGDFFDKEVDFYVVREGQNLSIYMDANEGEGPLECPMEAPSSLPTLINMNEKDLPLQLFGAAFKYVTDIWVADSTTNSSSLKGLAKPATRYQFAHDLSLETSYFDFKNFFMDKFGGFATVYGMVSPGSNAGRETEQWHWTTEKSQDGTANGYSPQDRVLKLYQPHHTLGIENFNFTSNFTVSAFVRTKSAGTFIKFENSAGQKVEINRWWKKSAYEIRLNGAKINTMFVNNLTSDTMWDNWNHITIVKNKNIIGIFRNGNFDGYFSLSDSQLNDIGFCDLHFVGNIPKETVYLSGLKVLPYAVTNIPANSFGSRTTYSEIDALKNKID